jgi:hypothetical protein
MYKLTGSLLIGILFWGCSNSAPVDLGNFDTEGFRSDRGGCENKREALQSDLKAVKDKLLGLSENQTIKALGRYDYQILDRKNEKVFIYFLEKGPQCEHIQNPSSALTMAVYLNSVSLVKEVTFQKGKP